MLRFMKACNKTSLFKQCCNFPLHSGDGRQQSNSPIWFSHHQGQSQPQEQEPMQFGGLKVFTLLLSSHIFWYICWFYLLPLSEGWIWMWDVFLSYLPVTFSFHPFSLHISDWAIIVLIDTHFLSPDWVKFMKQMTTTIQGQGGCCQTTGKPLLAPTHHKACVFIRDHPGP